MEKYLDQAGVQILWTKTKEKIASEIQGASVKSHTHPISDITNLQSTLDSKADTTEISNLNLKIGALETFKTSASNQLNGLKKGEANGVASLGSDGKVPSSQLPSYVDDVLEYDTKTAFPATGESGKIYVSKDDNKTYRWGGTSYVEISASLALGETSSTAYAGDKGKANAEAITALQSGKADKNHTHTSAQITDLQGKLDAKANTTHTHVTADITDLQGKLDAKANATHTHAISDITNLQNTLDGKASVSHNHDNKYVALDNSGGTRNYRYQIKYNQSNTPLTIRGWKNPIGTGVDEGQIVLGESYDYPVIIKALATNQPQNDSGKILRLGRQYGLQIGHYNSGNNPDTTYYDVLDSSMALTEDELNSILV